MADMGNIATAAGADLDTAAKRYAASQGWAMPDGSYTIRPADMRGAEDLANAIRAVGRGSASGETIRKHVMTRARALGMTDKIPDTWNADGTLSDDGDGRAAVIDGIEYRSFEADMEIRAGDGGDGRTLVGYAVPFDQPQRINSHLTEAFDRHAVDHQMAAIHRVAYYGPGHRRDGGPQVGHIALARPEPKGLYVESKIAKTPDGDNALELWRNGSLRDQSVGFKTTRNGQELRNGVTWRTKVHLTELAAVPNGAYGEGASIVAARSAQDIELELRENLAVTGLCPTCGHHELTRAEQVEEMIKHMRRIEL